MPPKRCDRGIGGRCLGTFGRAGCFSFSPNKTITTGQGGLVVTDDDALAVRLRELKDQGRPVRGTGGNDVHASIGFNFKLTNLQAAVGLAQLARLDARIERLAAIYREYRHGLAGLDQVRLLPFDVDARRDRRSGSMRSSNDRDAPRRPSERRRHPLPAVLVSDPHAAAVPALRRGVSERDACLLPRALWLPSALSLSDDDVQTVCRRIREFYTMHAARDHRRRDARSSPS